MRRNILWSQFKIKHSGLVQHYKVFWFRSSWPQVKYFSGFLWWKNWKFSGKLRPVWGNCQLCRNCVSCQKFLIKSTLSIQTPPRISSEASVKSIALAVHVWFLFTVTLIDVLSIRWNPHKVFLRVAEIATVGTGRSEEEDSAGSNLRFFSPTFGLSQENSGMGWIETWWDCQRKRIIQSQPEVGVLLWSGSP